MPITENFDAYLNKFGVTINVTSGTGAPYSFTAIYDNGYEGILIGEAEIEGTMPQLACKTSAITNLAQGDALTVNSANYTVVSIQPDGTGWATVKLHDA